jgi:hypothetical protein
MKDGARAAITEEPASAPPATAYWVRAFAAFGDETVDVRGDNG